MHSGVTRGPLWSAEHLVRANVEAARELVRRDSFHAEDALPRALATAALPSTQRDAVLA